MPKIPVGDKGDYYWVDSWDYVLSLKYTESKEAYDAFNGSGISIYERMAMRYKGQIPDDYWMLDVGTVNYGKDFVTIERVWAHKNHFHIVRRQRD